MILGLNSDVRYKGKTFHIQTEDSGKANPVLITHVFIAGTIIATFKTDYTDASDRDDMEDHVRGLMRAQHRSAYEKLMGGEFDEAATRGARPSTRMGDIPLANNKGPVGLMTPPVSRVPASSEPPATLDAPLTVEESAEITHDLHGDDDVTVLGSMEVVLLDDEAEEVARSSVVQSEGSVEYPTTLLSKRPLPSLIVAYLVEDVDS